MGMPGAVDRRTFLSLLAAVPRPLKITGVEIWKFTGERESVPGVDQQYQVQQLHIYPELRPKIYKDTPGAPPRKSRTAALYLKIRTDQDLDGLYGPVDSECVPVINAQLRPFLLGKDALAGETLWDQMYRLNRHSRAGHFMMAISAVDNALWDLRGRFFNTPVYRLLGGPTRTQVEAYGSCLGFSLEPEKVKAKCAELCNEGFRNLKWFMADGPSSGREGLHRNVELVRLTREAAGENVELMFDAFMGWHLDYAIAWAKQAEPYHPRWIEEAFPMDRMDAFVALRKATSIPVAAGEHMYGRWMANEFLRAGAISVVQADPEWCGGVSELVKICNIASLYDAQVIPHGHSLHAALHVAASQSPGTCPLIEYLITKMRSYYHFEKNPPALVKAMIALPERPGFGIEIDPAKTLSREIVQ